MWPAASRSFEPWLCLSYSPDGRRLAALAEDERTVLPRCTNTKRQPDSAGTNTVQCLSTPIAPSPRAAAPPSSCGKLTPASGGWARGGAETAAHPLLTIRPATILNGHTDEVYAVAFRPDGARLASAGRDGAVWLWALARGEEVARLPGHKAYVWSLAFSPDGTTLASGSEDSTVRLWDTAPLEARYQARREAAALRPEAERSSRIVRQKPDATKVVKLSKRSRSERCAMLPCGLYYFSAAPKLALVKTSDPPR